MPFNSFKIKNPKKFEQKVYKSLTWNVKGFVLSKVVKKKPLKWDGHSAAIFALLRALTYLKSKKSEKNVK